MGTTGNRSLPYPDGTDAPFVHLDVKALAEAVDADLQGIVDAPALNLPEPVWVEDTSASQVIVATSYAPIPNAPVIAVMSGLEANTVVRVTHHAWVSLNSATGSVDIRTDVEISGCGLSIPAGTPIGHQTVRNNNATTGFGTTSTQYTKMVKTLTSGTLTCQIKAQKSGTVDAGFRYGAIYIEALGIWP